MHLKKILWLPIVQYLKSNNFNFFFMYMQIWNAHNSPNLFSSIFQYHHLQNQCSSSLFTVLSKSPESTDMQGIQGELGSRCYLTFRDHKNLFITEWSSCESFATFAHVWHMLKGKICSFSFYLTHKCLLYKDMGKISFAKDVLKNYYQTWMYFMNMKYIQQ